MKSSGPEDNKPTVERQIDENLRRVYQQMVDESVPDKFMQLLQQLKEQDREK
jgi:hypothetical protein